MATKYNAISLATLSELEQALDQSANDNNVKVIAFTGEGKKRLLLVQIYQK